MTALVLLAACTGDDEGDEAPPRFGNADGELLVLAESDAPKNMTLRGDLSGPQTLYQYTGDATRVEELRALGTNGGYLQQFDAEVSDLGEPDPSPPLNATTLYSEALIFDDNESASDGLEYLREQPNPALDDVDLGDVEEFGRDAFLQTSSSGEPSTPYRNAGYYWRTANAVISVIAQGSGVRPDTGELLELAREVAKSVASADATGENLDLPAAPTPGEVIFQDDFAKEGAWNLTTAADPPGSRLTRYVNDAFQVGIDGPGGRWHDTGELAVGELRRLGDTIVEADVELLEGETARWGLMCDVVKSAGFYVFVVGPDGFAGVFAATSLSQPLGSLAVTPDNEVLRDAVADGQHRLRVDCAGAPIARLALYVNDELILEAYDDDPLPDGAAGMWVESQDTPASTLFDNFTVSSVTGSS